MKPEVSNVHILRATVDRREIGVIQRGALHDKIDREVVWKILLPQIILTLLSASIE
jgi:hypothetical protein